MKKLLLMVVLVVLGTAQVSQAITPYQKCKQRCLVSALNYQQCLNSCQIIL